MTIRDPPIVPAPHAPPLKTPTGRNAGIDVLRGLAIVLVVTHHTALRIPLRATALAAFVPRRLLDVFGYCGYESVFVFFVVSGFLITGNALRRYGTLGRLAWRQFYARRAARIAPCLCVLVVVLSVLDLLGIPDYVITQPDQSLPRAILAAAALHLNWYEGRTGYLPGNWDVLWSLSIEEAFYLGFPLLCLASRLSGRVLVGLLVLLALSLPMTRAALASTEIWQEKAYLPGMAAIAAGLLAALATARMDGAPRALAGLLTACGALLVASVLLWEDVQWHWLGNGTMLILTGGTAMLVMGLQQGRWAVPGTGWLQSFGRLSYEIYLTHMFVVFGVVRMFRALGLSPWLGCLVYPLILGGAWLLGVIVARGVAAPAHSVGRHLSAGWGVPPPPDPPSRMGARP
jgi:peptidoglycan/LPS O-acetylase OafA/YrhL